MRIEFPHSAREDFCWDQAQLSIGSAQDNDLVLGAHQAAAHHLRLRRGRGGCRLEVLSGSHRIYVNARPVRERTLLRAGDVLSVGDCRMLLKADQDPATREPIRVPENSRCPVALRAVAGPLSGRVFALREQVELGPQSSVPLELPQGERASLRLFWRDGQLRLEQGLVSQRYPLKVNGVEVPDLALHPDDQLGLATHRFVVDAPGMQPEPSVPEMAERADALPEESAGPRGEVWWLIVTAAVLALAIALMLLVRV